MNDEITALKEEIITMKRRRAYEVSVAVEVRHEIHVTCKDYCGACLMTHDSMM